MRIFSRLLVLAWVTGIATLALAQNNEIRIAHLLDKTGPLEPFATQTSVGLKMGLEYATGGTMEVAGKKIVIINKDTQMKADLGRSLLQNAYTDDKVDLAVGPSSSAVALAAIPVARENKKVLIIDAAAAEYLTGARSNRYVFRTGRNSDHDGYSGAVVFGKPGYFIATLAPDYAFGREGVASFKAAMKETKGQLVHEEYAPLGTTDFSAQALRMFNALKDKPGRKIIWIIWAGPGNPMKLLDLDPGRHGIEIVSGGGATLLTMPGLKPLVGAESTTHYWFQCPKNAANDWLIKEHQTRFGVPPDFFTATGMITGIAIVEALKKTKGVTDTETLIAALEGLSFDGPKGRNYFNKDNHQLMQPMYHYRIKLDDKITGGVGAECVREIKIDEMNFPIVKLK